MNFHNWQWDWTLLFRLISLGGTTVGLNIYSVKHKPCFNPLYPFMLQMKFICEGPNLEICHSEGSVLQSVGVLMLSSGQNSWRARLSVRIWGRICPVPPTVSRSLEGPAPFPPLFWPQRRRRLTLSNSLRKIWRNWRNEKRRRRKGNYDSKQSEVLVVFKWFWGLAVLNVLLQSCIYLSEFHTGMAFLFILNHS